MDKFPELNKFLERFPCDEKIPTMLPMEYAMMYPTVLKTLWRLTGFTTFGNGQLHTLDPRFSETLMEHFREKLPKEATMGATPILASGFGDLVLWSFIGNHTLIRVSKLMAFTFPLPSNQMESSTQVLLSMITPENLDYRKNGISRFEQARIYHGDLQYGQVFATDEPLNREETISINKIKKITIEEHVRNMMENWV